MNRWEVTITAEAEVVTALDTLLAIRALCSSRQTDATDDGDKTDTDTIWPSEILKILDGAL